MAGPRTSEQDRSPPLYPTLHVWSRRYVFVVGQPRRPLRGPLDHRVRMGPTFRADVWTVLEKMPGLSVAEVARRASCSFATAWQTAQDFQLLQAATSQT